MTTGTPDRAARAFETHEAYDRTGEGFELTTTVFESSVRVSTRDEQALRYTVTVFVPTLDAAIDGEVGTTLCESWQETTTRRLEEAPKSVRSNVDLDEFAVDRVGDELRIRYVFTWNNPRRAVEMVKTFAEYVEGTYVEGIVPGYEYQPPVSSLLSDASQSGESGTPL